MTDPHLRTRGVRVYVLKENAESHPAYSMFFQRQPLVVKHVEQSLTHPGELVEVYETEAEHLFRFCQRGMELIIGGELPLGAMVELEIIIKGFIPAPEVLPTARRDCPHCHQDIDIGP